MRRHRRAPSIAMAVALMASLAAAVASRSAEAVVAETLPTGFQEQIVFGGGPEVLYSPTNLEFAPEPDGRIFVAEKWGVIKFFDDLADTTPTTFADLRTVVSNHGDRGILGMALAPNFNDDPSVYILYVYDAPSGQNAPF